MKHLIIISLLGLLMSCANDINITEQSTACGCENPQENLAWLKALIQKSETDKTGNYLGTIWLLNYEGLSRHIRYGHDVR
ncbi:MAG: hypothetical protein LBR84_01210 [Tannerella sp.]|jgi:hypothetical protein|nr:hypothetical protein [Tannerella sp.]